MRRCLFLTELFVALLALAALGIVLRAGRASTA